MDFESTLNNYITQTNSAITQFIPSPNTHPHYLHQAIHYAINSGGKRLRPTLLLAAFNLAPNNLDPLPAAVAIESIHAYSLIHDDLPCMDNSPLRRGKPSSHIQFDEPTALLAGDALLTLAFQLIPQYYHDHPQVSSSLSLTLATASNSQHLIGGQAEDIHPSESNNPEDTLLFINSNKTAALFQAALQMGLIINNSSPEKLLLAKQLGLHLGLAYQIIDDILDETSSPSTLGKPTNQSTLNNTLTYPQVYGIASAKDKATHHTQEALNLTLQLSPNNNFLHNLTQKLLHREF